MNNEQRVEGVRLAETPGHMRRAAREIIEACAKMDFVIVVVDARAPLTTDNPRFRRLLPDLPVLLVAVKSDLAPLTDRVNDYLYVSTKNRADIAVVHHVLQRTLKERVESRKAAGMAVVKSYGIVIGLPNTGKSSLINFLARAKKTDAQNRPGVTRRQQWVKVTPELELWDTPGVLPSRVQQERDLYVAALLNLVPYDEVIAGKAFVWLLGQPQFKLADALNQHYGLGQTGSLLEVLTALAVKKGYLLKGGHPDTARAQLLLFKDFSEGVLGRFNLDVANPADPSAG